MTIAYDQPRITNPRLRQAIRKVALQIGFDTTDWVRVVMYKRCFERVRALAPQSLDVLEISAGPQWAREFRFKSYLGTHYPDYDVCEQTLDGRFDLIIADQVFEHLKRPLRAGKNVHAMLRPGGTLIIATPFLLRIHNSPGDYSRWTEQGLSSLLQESGFSENLIETQSWGNRACVVANFKSWKKRGWFRSLHNEPQFPVMVWAFARKSIETA